MSTLYMLYIIYIYIYILAYTEIKGFTSGNLWICRIRHCELYFVVALEVYEEVRTRDIVPKNITNKTTNTFPNDWEHDSILSYEVNCEECWSKLLPFLAVTPLTSFISRSKPRELWGGQSRYHWHHKFSCGQLSTLNNLVYKGFPNIEPMRNIY